MHHQDIWRPSKFVLVDGELRADKTGRYVSVGSRIVADLMAQNYAAALRKYARGNLLDLGCGNAPLFETYRSLVDSVWCVDWPFSIHQQKHIDVFADLTKPLPLRDGSFDTVVLSDVLEHIPNPECLVGEIGRVMRSSGHVIIGVPFFYWLHEAPHDFNRYTRYQLERFYKLAGLEVVQITEVGGGPEVLADIAGKILSAKPRLASVFVALAARILKYKATKRISAKTRETFPLAYIAIGQKP